MPNLVGIGNSQVPTNAMLGGLAYQDSVGEIDIDKIKARTSDTAVDVFVYDTRKDSDGGAWRYRTQNKSWYNEGASATRGARKEFPVVAVLVLKADDFIIYDGDDPNLPMWMVFKKAGNSYFSITTNSCVAALNGKIASGGNASNDRLRVIDFLLDNEREYSHSDGQHTHFNPISGRNETVGFTPYDSSLPGLVNRYINDVAMTVLPNAPIDETTGLPIPTIGVATPDGVSIIKDDGTVVDIIGNHGGSGNDTQFVDFDSKTNAVISGFDYGAGNTNAIYKLHVFPIPDTDITENTFYNAYQNHHRRVQTGTNVTVPKLQGNYLRDAISAGGNGRYAIRTGNSPGTGYPAALNIMQEEPGTDGSNTNFPSNSRIAYITKDYNTGWMHGDIKGAFMSDTDTTNLTDTQAVTNPGPFTSTTGWAAANAGWSVSDSNNRLVINSGSQTGSYFGAAQTLSLTDGKKYVLVVNIHSQTKTAVIRLTADGNYFTSTGLGTGEHSFYFTANQATHSIFIGSDTGGTNREQQVSSVTIREVEEDRSHYHKGLQAFGTITKSTVATGTDLVAYSGFSNSNYLLQPYNSDLNFTDTMMIMLWVKGWVGSDSLLHRGPGTTRNSKTSFHLYCSYDHNYRITFTTNGSSEQTFEIPLSGSLTGWQHLCFTLSGGTVKGYLNGVEKTLSSTSFSGNIFSQATDQNGLYIGTGPVGGPAATASLALLRLSASAPSADQIKKIYNDEKCLFHENAKCTLYGTADAITAIAYDDTNDILHAATSSGRSEFQGLNRINNTTTAVTTAISASNELVAEQ